MLREDGNYRGRNAVHVLPHSKLGKHRTIILGALPVVNWLIDQPKVTQMNLGQMRSLWPVRKEEWMRCEPVEGKNLLRLIVMDGRAVQFLTVEVVSGSAVEKVIGKLRKRFPTSTISVVSGNV